MNHTEEVQHAIQQQTARLAELDTHIEQCNLSIGQALTGAQPDEKAADRLQVERDGVARERERCQLRLNALQAELPNAEKADAQDRLAAIVAEAVELDASRAEATQELARALAMLPELIERAFNPKLRRRDLQGETEYFCSLYCLPVPQLPALEMPDLQPIRDLYQLAAAKVERQFDFFNSWQSKLAALNSQRKRERYGAKPERMPEPHFPN